MPVLQNSTYLDFTSWHAYFNDTAPTTLPQTAYGWDPAWIFTPTATVNVALILPRANDPTSLLGSNWATRQQTLAELSADGTLWQTYGADQSQYDSLVSQLQGLGITILGQGGDGYVSSVESRTVWVSLDATQFNTLFGTPLLGVGSSAAAIDSFFWNGSLSVPDSFGVTSLWIDSGNEFTVQAQDSSAYNPTVGPQSVGNAATAFSSLYPQQVAALYNFPLSGSTFVTGTLALIEPEVGSSLPAGTTTSFGALLGAYLAEAQVAGTPSLYTVDDGGQHYTNGAAGERSLDISVVAAVNPYGNFGFYAGSGRAQGARSTTFTAYQSAFWDTTNQPSVVSSSWSDLMWSSPGSPFFAAYQELFADAALRNITTFIAAGDGGSGMFAADGLNNLWYSSSTPYAVLVGGTSVTLSQSAASDSSLGVLLTGAQAEDPAVIWGLLQSGLKTMPTALAPTDPLLESVWNAYNIRTDNRFAPPMSGDNAGAGGVDTRLSVPGYQSDYGLTPTNNDPLGGTGRGLPDVSALAGGDTYYIALVGNMETTSSEWHGTSAAAPLWAALAMQINTIFADQGLPALGYANDLLYIAAVVAPGAYNDIVQGNNISSYTSGSGPYDSDGTQIALTGHGYSAEAGYDLASGLGSPNGLLLARALSAIAHSQMSFSSSPALLDQDGDGWSSGADQSLLFQTTSTGQVSVGIGLGSNFTGFVSQGSAAYSWSSQVAQQSLQADFDSNLVRLFDKQGQGALMQLEVHDGESLAVAVGQQLGSAVQAALSNPFGFADFFTDDGTVRVARAVAVAETVGGDADQTAIVRVRQNGTDSLSITFYKVDDFSGKISGLDPGDAGYLQAALTRAYQLEGGGISMGGPGYGNYQQGALLDVDGGDKIAMMLTNNTSGATFWAFSQANESVAGQMVGHLWNYGLNTWGFEDTYGGGDGDYNDLIVQFDFTSAYGHGWLA